MAGIGFELKKIVKENSFLSRIKAYAFSSIVIVGPMALCILIIGAAQFFLTLLGTSLKERDLFLAATEYSFIFSQLITGFFTMFLSRYLADQLFSKNEKFILSSLFGMTAICLLLAMICGMIFYIPSPLPWDFKLASYIFFIELIMIWVQSVYISALREYMKIIKGFILGTGLALIAFMFSFLFLEFRTALASFICLDIGFFVIVLTFFKEIKKMFPVNNKQYFNFLHSVDKYPALLFIGFFYTVGLYGHNFIVWKGSLQKTIGDTFITAPLYDVPVFYAYLSILPVMVLFVVSAETNFYEKYKTYYSRVVGSFSFKEINSAKKDMIKVLKRQLNLMMEFQLVFSFVSLALGIQVLPKIGLKSDQINTFILITIGNNFFILMFIMMLLLLYFDDRKGSLTIISCYAASNLLLTFVLGNTDKLGLSCLLAGFIGFAIALARLSYYMGNLDYYTFCSQPMYAKEKNTLFQRLIERMNV